MIPLYINVYFFSSVARFVPRLENQRAYFEEYIIQYRATLITRSFHPHHRSYFLWVVLASYSVMMQSWSICRHINDSTLFRASVQFSVFEERKSRRSPIRTDTRAMPSDFFVCWYLILQRERSKSKRVRNDVWRRGKQIERGKKIKSLLENVPIITKALQQLSWPKIDWIESSLMTRVACNKGRLENFSLDSFVFILAVLTNLQYFLLSFKCRLKYWV